MFNFISSLINLETYNFLILYILIFQILLCSSGVIFSKNPVDSILLLMLVFINISGILLLLDLTFISVIFVIIYVGAIAVLFLFVVMMLNIKIIQLESRSLANIIVSFIFLIILLLQFYFISNSLIFFRLENHEYIVGNVFFDFYEDLKPKTNIKNLGNVLYTDFCKCFLLCGFVLLIAMISSIILTLSHKVNIKRQNIFFQNNINFNKNFNIKKNEL